MQNPSYSDDSPQSTIIETDLKDLCTKLSTLVSHLTPSSKSASHDPPLDTAAPLSYNGDPLEVKFRRLAEQLRQEISRSADAHEIARRRESRLFELEQENELLMVRLNTEISGQLDSHHWEERYVALRKKQNDAEEIVRAYQDKVDRLDGSLLSVQAELRDSLRVCSSLNAKSAASDERAARAGADLAASNERMTALRSENTKQAGRIIALKKRLESLEKVDIIVSRLEEENTCLLQRFRELSQDKLTAVDTAAQAQLALSEKCAEIFELRAALRKAAEPRPDRIVEKPYQPSVDHFKETIDCLTRENAERSNEVVHLKSKVSMLQAEREALRKKLVFFQKKTEPPPPGDREVFMIAQMEEVKNDIFRERQERERAQKEIFILREKLRKSDKTLKNTEEQNLRLQHAHLRARARETPQTPPQPQPTPFSEKSDDQDLEDLLEATPVVLRLPNKN